MSRKMIYLCFIILFIVFTNEVLSHVILQRVLDTELKMTNYVERHVKQLASSVWKIERGVHKLRSARWSHMDKEEYIGSPLTAMVMVRRLAQDWPPIAFMVSKFAKLHYMQLGLVRWPTRTDMEEAARAVMRTQMTYDLNTSLLVRGIQSNTFLTNVTAADCLEIARQYFIREQFSDATTWLQHGLNEIHSYDEVSIRETVLYYMAASLCFSDDAKGSINILRKILEENPRSSPPEDLMNYYSLMGTRGCLQPKSGKQISLQRRHNQGYLIEFYRNNTAAEEYSRLCRGQARVDSAVRCRYVHYQQPHLMFQPFKLEELQLDPPVVRFYDLISDTESESLIRKAKYQMQPATVGADGRVSEYRTSQVAWLYTSSTDWLSRRISEATQLDTEFAEEHQISRYSVSGEYLPHKDHFSYQEHYWADDRIATVMFYLNDVEQGGNTIFTRWNLSVPPVKNSAILWFNYKPRGVGDEDSEHSGCPVLKGTKWVLNKWVHNGGNDVNFPCTLDQYGSFKGFYL